MISCTVVQCHGSGAGKKVSLSVGVSSLFYHFKCLQLLALIKKKKKKKTHDLGILHSVKFTVNKFYEFMHLC